MYHYYAIDVPAYLKIHFCNLQTRSNQMIEKKKSPQKFLLVLQSIPFTFNYHHYILSLHLQRQSRPHHTQENQTIPKPNDSFLSHPAIPLCYIPLYRRHSQKAARESAAPARREEIWNCSACDYRRTAQGIMSAATSGVKQRQHPRRRTKFPALSGCRSEHAVHISPRLASAADSRAAFVPHFHLGAFRTPKLVVQ